MAKGRPNEPLTSPRFIVRFPKLKGVFSEVSASAAEFEVISYNLPRRTAPRLLCSAGHDEATGDHLEARCHRRCLGLAVGQKVQDGKMASARSNGTIHLCDYDGTSLLEFTVVNAWPKKVTMPGPKSDSNEILFEEIVPVCEQFERQR